MHGRVVSRPGELPTYWQILSDDDKRGYIELRRGLEPLSVRSDKDQLQVRFEVILTRIQLFALRHDEHDWKRCLVCGIAWLEGAVAMNMRQLALLIPKCKSSINTGFQTMGYGVVPMTSRHIARLVRLFPFLMENANKMRQWTLRAQRGHKPNRPPDAARPAGLPSKTFAGRIEDLLNPVEQPDQPVDWWEIDAGFQELPA
jgi:hypothetical protein